MYNANPSQQQYKRTFLDFKYYWKRAEMISSILSALIMCFLINQVCGSDGTGYFVKARHTTDVSHRQDTSIYNECEKPELLL